MTHPTDLIARRSNEIRDPANGQYAFSGDMERLCTCGHILGEHIAGGFECQCVVGRDCKCLKFKQSRKKKS